MLNFIVKFTIIFICSISTYASELKMEKSEQEVISKANTELANKELFNVLNSLSISLDNLAKSTLESSSALKGGNQPSKEYLELHRAILKTSNAIHDAVVQNTLPPTNIKENNENFPVLKERVDNLYQSKSYFSYADFAAIAITSVAVLITLGGIVIAGLSFWGYKNIKNTTEKKAGEVAKLVSTETTKETIDKVVKAKLEELLDEGKFNKHLEDVVDALIIRNKNGNKSVDWDELDEEIDWDEYSEAIDNILDEEVRK